MNDRIIINTISKIHFILVSALSFIFLTLFLIFVLLQNGIYIEDLSLQNFKVKKLYIKWDEKISVVAKELKITKEADSKQNIDYSAVAKKVGKTLLFSSLFEQITINKLSLNNINGSFKYIEGDKGYLNLSSKDFLLNSSLYSQQNLFKIEIGEFKISDKEINIGGAIEFNIYSRVDLNASLYVKMNSDTKLNIYLNGDTDGLSYKIDSNEKIKNTKEIVDIFNLDPKVKYWVYDAMKMTSLSISSFHGWINYKNIDTAYLNIYAKAIANDLTYTYDKKVASVRTGHTELEFKNGVLYIRPQNAYTYDFFLDKSWLKIDFSKKEEILSLYLLFKGMANSDLLSLLNRYNIKLPFTQTKGELDTNLQLEINLITMDVTAHGNLYTKEAQINYLGLDIDVFDTNISINNSHVKVDEFFAKYKDIATSHVDLDFNAKDSNGTLNFMVNKLSFKELGLKLAKRKTPLHVIYNISPLQDYLNINRSTWELKGDKIKVNSIKMPFNIKELTAELPVTSVKIKKSTSALVSGKIELKSKKANLNIDLLKLNYAGIKLNQSRTRINLNYDKKITIYSHKPIKFKSDNLDILTKGGVVEIDSNKLLMKKISFNIDNMVKSKISAQYNFKDSNGSINLHNLEVSNKSFGEIFKNNKSTILNIQSDHGNTLISSKEYGVEYMLRKDSWVTKFNSIKKIARKSKILTDYSLDNGSFTLYKKNSETTMKFELDSDYKYKFLALNHKPVDRYIVNGVIDNKNNISLKINSVVDVNITDDIKINAESVGIDINEILNFIDSASSDTDSKKSPNIHLDAKNSYIYISKDRYAISDKIEFKYINKVLTAQLTHKKGGAIFKFENNKFNLFGKDFNDEFIQNLLSPSKFKHGTLSFSVNGSKDEYNGVFFLKDTIILDYRLLNNVLAFVNTIPSLVTFSLPGYNKRGLAVENAYMKFKAKDKVYNISDIYLKSKEMDITGKGEASIEKNSINLDLNLKTDLGSSVSKIPVVGHILLGGDTISTTLNINGKLDDPKINTRLAKDIAVAPLNIVKRILLYPFELFKSEDEKKK